MTALTRRISDQSVRSVMPSAPPFPAAEYGRRWEDLRTLMAREDIDAILVTTRTNYEYLSGHRTMAWMIKSRPLALILPLSGSPLVVVPVSLEPCVQAVGVVGEIRPYQGFEDAATTTIVESVDHLGLNAATIGLELGREQRMGLPPAQIDRLRAALPKARFVDGGALLWEIRARKSTAEIEYLRRAGCVTGEAYDALFDELAAGWTERQIFAEFSATVLRRGADRPGYITMTHGPGTYACYSGWPSNRTLVDGELFWMDAGCVVESYWSDYTRCVAVGRASLSQMRTYKGMVGVLDDVLAEVRPGVAVSTLMEAATDACRRLGYPMRVASRVGHGIGMDLTEPPSLAMDDGSVLEPGMAITVEPGILTPDGWFHLEENLVVTEHGYDRLSVPMPRELPVVGRQ
jgi:Xaa-Pro dipeptidase